MVSKRIFDLSGVASEEADGVRTALEKYGVKYYETPSQNWGWGTAAIWVNSEKDVARARMAIENFQETFVAMNSGTTDDAVQADSYKLKVKYVAGVMTALLIGYYVLERIYLATK